MSNKFFETVEELKETVFPKIKDILVVFLYGSVERGDFSLRHSDLDLFIIIRNKKVSETMKERINKKIFQTGQKFGVKVHPEYQGIDIKPEDRTLLRKMIEEGKIIYSTGTFTFDNKQIGLKQFIIYEYKVGKGKTMFSKVLHGRKSWYYKNKKRIIKEYKGIIDGEEIITLGKGFLMISKDRQKDIKKAFENFDIEYTFKKIVYA